MQRDRIPRTRPIPPDAYTISTPYGQVIITDHGRAVTFHIWDDVKQSEHNAALFRYVEHLHQSGIERINADHISLPYLRPDIPLVRGDRKLDVVYYKGPRIFECELKTRRELGLDVTARHLRDLVKRCENLVLLVPTTELEEARIILEIIELTGRITIDTYEVPL
ncbi:hypothetical protein ES703_103829 [subsurface metagenome]